MLGLVLCTPFGTPSEVGLILGPPGEIGSLLGRLVDTLGLPDAAGSVLGLVLGTPLGSPDSVGLLLAVASLADTVATPATPTAAAVATSGTTSPATDCCRL